MNSFYRKTLFFSAVETLGTRFLVAGHYLLLAYIMSPESFGQICALYSIIFLGSTISSSGMITSLTILEGSHNDAGTIPRLYQAAKCQWLLALPLALVTVLVLIYGTLAHSQENVWLITALSLLFCLAQVVKKQLNHTLKLGDLQALSTITDLLYHSVCVIALFLLYIAGICINLITILALLNVFTLLLIAYYVHTIFLHQSNRCAVTTEHQNNLPKQTHRHHVITDMAKLCFSSNAIVLLLYSTLGPVAAGYLKGLHAISQLFLSSGGKFISSITHLHYAAYARVVYAQQDTVRKSLRWGAIWMLIGLSVALLGIVANGHLWTYARTHTVATIAFLLLFATNHVENLLQFSVISQGRSAMVAAAAVGGVLLLSLMICLLGSSCTITTIAVPFLLARALSLGFLCLIYYLSLSPDCASSSGRSRTKKVSQ